ncbi:MAG TPA: cytochrome c [Aggregatilineales bacterium]|nr:cytochrome c [Aggregatilineales bacterium]
MLFLAACSAAPSTPSASPAPTFLPGSIEALGAALFQGKGRCSTCHSLSPGTVIYGPSLAGIATRAGQRESGVSAADYIEESILLPDKFKVPGFEDKQMDNTLAKSLTTDEVADLVAYLMTQK